MRTLKLFWQCSGIFAKHIRAACGCISPERVAFSVRCCPHLPHYSLKLAATASVPAFNETSAPSNRNKWSREERRQVTSALVYFTTNRSSMHMKTVKWWKWDGIWYWTHHNGWLWCTTAPVSKACPSLQANQPQLGADWLLNLNISTTRPWRCILSTSNHKCLLLACSV